MRKKRELVGTREEEWRQGRGLGGRWVGQRIGGAEFDHQQQQQEGKSVINKCLKLSILAFGRQRDNVYSELKGQPGLWEECKQARAI